MDGKEIDKKANQLTFAVTMLVLLVVLVAGLVAVTLDLSEPFQGNVMRAVFLIVLAIFAFLLLREFITWY